MNFRRYIVCLFCGALSYLLAWGESVTYTMTSYHEVSVSGEEPESASAEFMSDTKSGTRISADHTARLDLYGYDGCRIQELTLFMRSNKSSGAGSLQVLLDDSVVASIPDSPFSDEAWNGAYVNDSLVSIVVPLFPSPQVPENGRLSIIVSASVNSLYFGACEVHYMIAPLLPYTVTFVTGTDDSIHPKRESGVGKGILLPDYQFADSVWHFLGWTENPLTQTPVCPVYYKAGTRYFPTKHQTLYALYSNEVTDASIVQDTCLQSGTYALVTETAHPMMMCGYVDNERVATDEVELRFGADSLYHLQMGTIPADSRYQLNVADGKATISHVKSNTYIGYRATSSSHGLRSSASEWELLPSANGSYQFYHDLHANGMAYTLYPQYRDGVYSFMDTDLLLSATTQFMLLFPVPETEPQPALYTTNPRSHVGFEAVAQERTCRVYRLDGTCIHSSATAETLRSLPRGIYIITSPSGTQKQIVR